MKRMIVVLMVLGAAAGVMAQTFTDLAGNATYEGKTGLKKMATAIDANFALLEGYGLTTGNHPWARISNAVNTTVSGGVTITKAGVATVAVAPAAALTGNIGIARMTNALAVSGAIPDGVVTTNEMPTAYPDSTFVITNGQGTASLTIKVQNGMITSITSN